MNNTTHKSIISKDSKYLIPVITIVLTLAVTLIITIVTKNFMSSGENANVSVANNQAEEYFYNKNYGNAISEYEKLQAKDGNPMWSVKIAEIYTIKGDYEKSNELLRNAYETRNKLTYSSGKNSLNEDEDAQLLNEIVFGYLMNNEYKKALEYGELFLQDHPENKELLKTMFTVYMANKNNDKAKDIIKNYEAETAKELVIKAKMNKSLDNFDEFLKLLKEAYDKDSEELSIFDAINEASKENKTILLKKISQLEEKNSDENVYKMWKAKIYLNNKDTLSKSEEILNKLEDAESDNNNFKLLKADMYEKMNDSEESQKILQDIIHNAEETFLGTYASALNEYSKGNYDKALNEGKKLIVSDRDYIYSYTKIIPQILSKLNKQDQAEPYFRQALIKESFNINVICDIAEYYNNCKDTNSALYYYTIASEVQPDNAEIYYDIALIKIKNQRKDEAVKLLKTSIKLDDNKAKYHRALGVIYLEDKKNEDALTQIRKAYAIDENDILTLNNAGYYYMIVDKNIDRAIVNLKSAYDGINENTSEEQKQIITDNYNKVKAIYNDNNRVQIPELKLFY